MLGITVYLSSVLLVERGDLSYMNFLSLLHLPYLRFCISTHCQNHCRSMYSTITPGRDSPPLSNFLITSEIPVWALAFVGVVTGLGEVLIVFLIVFSIIWRENV